MIFKPDIAGEHSPVPTGLMNGRMQTSPTVQMSSSQQLPPACGARQLSKLKRFLTTLQQFGSDISAEIGERVRALVLGLVVSDLLIKKEII
jgi:runt-related transcription factor 1